jgi:hypothetical protein
MRFNSNINRLAGDDRYNAAQDVLHAILHTRIPAREPMLLLYGSTFAETLTAMIGQFLETQTDGFGTVREHNPSASTSISDARSRVEASPQHNRLQSSLLFGCVPDREELEPFYGKFAGCVRDILGLFIEFGLKRKCGISSTAHLNRVGAVVREMQLDDEGESVFSAVGVLHDALEDLLEVATDDSGHVYGIARYHEFLDHYFPLGLHEHLKLITNFYDLILHEMRRMLEREDRFTSKSNLLDTLESLYSSSNIELHPYLEKMHYVLDGSELGTDVFSAAKWLCYKELYISEMAIYTHGAADYRTFEIKAIDLSDNGHGRDSLALSSRIKNLIKQQVYAAYGRRLESTWHPLNDRIEELQEDALVHAEHIIIRDLLERQSVQDFIVSALLKIRSLRPVFFSDAHP